MGLTPAAATSRCARGNRPPGRPQRFLERAVRAFQPACRKGSAPPGSLLLAGRKHHAQGETMLIDSAHQPSGSTAAGGSVATTPTRVRVAPVCSAAGVASPRSSLRRQPDARVVDGNALTQPHPARPDQQPTPGCQCTGGASVDCPPSSARRPGCAAATVGQRRPAASPPPASPHHGAKKRTFADRPTSRRKRPPRSNPPPRRTPIPTPFRNWSRWPCRATSGPGMTWSSGIHRWCPR